MRGTNVGSHKMYLAVTGDQRVLMKCSCGREMKDKTAADVIGDHCAEIEEIEEQS